MEKGTRKIVILNRPESSYIEQAIFILRDVDNSQPQNEIHETDALSEAEKIIDSYIDSIRTPMGTVKKKRHLLKFLFFGALVIALEILTVKIMT